MLVMGTGNVFAEVSRKVDRQRSTAAVAGGEDLFVGGIMIRNEFRPFAQGFEVESRSNLRKVCMIGSNFV